MTHFHHIKPLSYALMFTLLTGTAAYANTDLNFEINVQGI